MRQGKWTEFADTISEKKDKAIKNANRSRPKRLNEEPKDALSFSEITHNHTG